MKVIGFRRSLIFILSGASLALSGPTARSAPAALSAALSPESIRFERVGATELATLKRVLERAGWPATHVQAVLNVEIQRRINPEFKPRFEDLKPFVFWHAGSDALPLAHLDTAAQRAERAEREEQARKKYDELFPSSEAEPEALQIWEEQRRWGALPSAQRAIVAKILENAERARDRFIETRGRMLTREEWEKVWTMNRETREQLTHALTPQELLDYDLRNSNTAEKMRSELDSFAPTREEFLALFKIRHPHEIAFGDKLRGIDPAIDAEQESAEKTEREKIAALLGPERFDDYQLSLQPACQLLRFDGRFARTDAATVRQLYRALLAAQSRLKETETLAESEKTTRASGIKAELYEQFRRVLDEEGARRYLQEQAVWP